MTKLNIEQASLHLGIAQASLRRKLNTGEITGTREPHAGGFRWMVDLPVDFAPDAPPTPPTSTPPPGEGSGDGMLMDQMQARIDSLEAQLTTRAGEIDQLHRLMAQTALSAAPARPWWRFWG